MNREEILEKSRQENKNKDVYEQELVKEGGNYGAMVAALLASIFFIVQIFVGLGQNYGLYAVVMSIPMTNVINKYRRQKKMQELVLAILYVFVVLMFSLVHMYNLVTASTIL